jgi:hypothetical protein
MRVDGRRRKRIDERWMNVSRGQHRLSEKCKNTAKTAAFCICGSAAQRAVDRPSTWMVEPCNTTTRALAWLVVGVDEASRASERMRMFDRALVHIDALDGDQKFAAK